MYNTIPIHAIMSYGIRTVEASQTLAEVGHVLQRIGHEGYPVVREGVLVGLLTSRDLSRALAHEQKLLTVGDIVLGNVVSLAPDDSLERALQLMQESGWGQIPVLDGDTLIGLVTRSDVIAALAPPSPSALPHLSTDTLAQVLGTSALTLLNAIGDLATTHQMPAFVVGGVVRDVLLSRPNDDIDIVLEGDATLFVQELVRSYGGTYEVHPRFGTAKWDLAGSHFGGKDALREGLPHFVDLVSARYEYYPHLGALPTVYRAGIRLDLRRRDFTINALAFHISPPEKFGQVLDPFHGYDDLQRGIIRELHPLSYQEDPTRIFRAVRYATRYGFSLSPHTQHLIRLTHATLRHVTGERLRNELTLMFLEPHFEQSLHLLTEYGILQAIHPALLLEGDVAQAIALALADGVESSLLWVIFFAHLENEFVSAVAERFLFSGKIVKTFEQASILRHKPHRVRFGNIADTTFFLDEFPLESVMANRYCALDDLTRSQYHDYLTHWRHIQPHTDGAVLQRKGIHPGPIYTAVRNRLRKHLLNGDITTPQDELALLDTWIKQGDL